MGGKKVQTMIFSANFNNAFVVRLQFPERGDSDTIERAFDRNDIFHIRRAYS